MTEESEAARELRYEATLRERYGELLTLDELAEVMRYRTVGALRQAYARGKLPVALVKMPGRRELLAHVTEVARWLASLGTED